MPRSLITKIELSSIMSKRKGSKNLNDYVGLNRHRSHRSRTNTGHNKHPYRNCNDFKVLFNHKKNKNNCTYLLIKNKIRIVKDDLLYSLRNSFQLLSNI